MPDPLSISGLGSSSPLQAAGRSRSVGAGSTPDGKSFKDVLLDSLEQVNQLQKEATDGVEKVVTGEPHNLAEVFTAVRKSEVAFNMLMEMRNKLLDAYREVQQMRV